MDNFIRPKENVNLIPCDCITASDSSEWLEVIHSYECKT